MLQEAIEKLQAEVEALNHELNVTLPAALKKAVANGDLRENGDYHAALERQGFVRARLNQLRSRLVKLSQIDTSKIPADRVGLGSQVVVEDLASGERERYELVVPDAVDFDEGHISVASPLGSALINKKQGEVADVRLPLGQRKLKVVELRTLHDLASEQIDTAGA
jgi:transcription elongation factor GreA